MSLTKHKWYKRKADGSRNGKTICTSHVLAELGVPSWHYHYSGQLAQRLAVLRRHGFAVRSRMSKLPKGATVGKARAAIRKLDDPAGTRYMLRVKGHALLLDATGQTIVDTAPRKADRRRVLAIHAVYQKRMGLAEAAELTAAARQYE